MVIWSSEGDGSFRQGTRDPLKGEKLEGYVQTEGFGTRYGSLGPEVVDLDELPLEFRLPEQLHTQVPEEEVPTEEEELGER